MNDADNPNYLFRFMHGMGDCCQFSIVLRHLKHYYPDRKICVESMPGCEGCFGSAPDETHAAIHPFFWRANGVYPFKTRHTIFARPERLQRRGIPATKPTRCLIEEHNLEPIAEFYYYEVTITDDDRARADRYIAETLGGAPFGLLHYMGESSPEDKDLNSDGAWAALRLLIRDGLTPVVLDWRHRPRCPYVDHETVHCPSQSDPMWEGIRTGGSAGVIAALIESAAFGIWIDSGPGHVAAAIPSTPGYVIWTNNHPLYCFDPADHLTHILPQRAIDTLGDLEREYFTTNYYHLGYKAGPAEALLDLSIHEVQ